MLLIAALLLKLTIGDRFYILKFAFYIPGLAALIAGPLLALAARGSGRLRLVLGAAGFFLGLLGLFQDQPRLFAPVPADAPPPPPPGAVKVLTWNVMAYWFGEQEIADFVVEESPDLLCLVEGTFAGRRPPYLSQRMGPGYNWAVGNRLSIASRLPILESEMLSTDGQSRILRAVIEGPRGPFAVFVVDAFTPRIRNDAETYREIWAYAKAEELPLLVAGDFNLPITSRWMNGAERAGLENAFLQERAPRYLASWPAWLPVWHIDQLFVRGMEAQAGYGNTTSSDHLPLVAEVW